MASMVGGDENINESKAINIMKSRVPKSTVNACKRYEDTLRPMLRPKAKNFNKLRNMIKSLR